MPPSNIWVIKLGGAMLATAELPAWLAACAATAGQSTRCVVVAGGGALADEVRALQARWQFDDGLAHELALDTMRLNARLLHGLAPGLTLSSAVEVAALPGDGGLIWVPPAQFAPPALPCSWAVTSDSIALWLAQSLGARVVVLVKSLPAQALRAASAANLAAQGHIDTFFAQLLASGSVPARLHGKHAWAEFEQRRRAGTLPGVALD